MKRLGGPARDERPLKKSRTEDPDANGSSAANSKTNGPTVNDLPEDVINRIFEILATDHLSSAGRNFALVNHRVRSVSGQYRATAREQLRANTLEVRNFPFAVDLQAGRGAARSNQGFWATWRAPVRNERIWQAWRGQFELVLAGLKEPYPAAAPALLIHTIARLKFAMRDAQLWESSFSTLLQCAAGIDPRNALVGLAHQVSNLEPSLRPLYFNQLRLMGLESLPAPWGQPHQAGEQAAALLRGALRGEIRIPLTDPLVVTAVGEVANALPWFGETEAVDKFQLLLQWSKGTTVAFRASLNPLPFLVDHFDRMGNHPAKGRCAKAVLDVDLAGKTVAEIPVNLLLKLAHFMSDAPEPQRTELFVRACKEFATVANGFAVQTKLLTACGQAMDASGNVPESWQAAYHAGIQALRSAGHGRSEPAMIQFARHLRHVPSGARPELLTWILGNFGQVKAERLAQGDFMFHALNDVLPWLIQEIQYLERPAERRDAAGMLIRHVVTSGAGSVCTTPELNLMLAAQVQHLAMADRQPFFEALLSSVSHGNLPNPVELVPDESAVKLALSQFLGWFRPVDRKAWVDAHVMGHAFPALFVAPSGLAVADFAAGGAWLQTIHAITGAYASLPWSAEDGETIGRICFMLEPMFDILMAEGGVDDADAFEFLAGETYLSKEQDQLLALVRDIAAGLVSCAHLLPSELQWQFCARAFEICPVVVRQWGVQVGRNYLTDLAGGCCKLARSADRANAVEQLLALMVSDPLTMELADTNTVLATSVLFHELAAADSDRLLSNWVGFAEALEKLRSKQGTHNPPAG
ncbi:MAG: hypothetical protein V4787_25870 [Pseudomonadota bacterium]